MNPGWHRYFDDNKWNVRDFHETWIREIKHEPKKLSYQKANDAMRKSLHCLVNDCKDDMKIQAAAKFLANKASIRKYTLCWSR